MTTIGKVLEDINSIPVDTPLTWSVNEDMGFKILDVCSYRGYYDEPALVVELVDVEMADNVSHLAKCLETLKSETFCGYKGGDYQYINDNELFLVESDSRSEFRDAVRTLKVKSDGTFKDKKSSY